MELILISKTKLKIMLDEEDMKKYRHSGISDKTEATTGRAIRSLLDIARQSVGFNTSGEEIFVQLYASKGGGCELFVTKSSSAESSDKVEERKRKDALPEKSEARALHPPKEGSVLCTPSEQKPSARDFGLSPMAFSFTRLSYLITVCKILLSTKRIKGGKAFTDGNEFYLYLSNTGSSAYSRLNKLTFINEYGKRENPEHFLSYISEHGRIICHENAVETLGRL